MLSGMKLIKERCATATIHVFPCHHITVYSIPENQCKLQQCISKLYNDFCMFQVHFCLLMLGISAK